MTINRLEQLLAVLSTASVLGDDLREAAGTAYDVVRAARYTFKIDGSDRVADLVVSVETGLTPTRRVRSVLEHCLHAMNEDELPPLRDEIWEILKGRELVEVPHKSMASALGEKIDWALLRDQKLSLLNVLDGKMPPSQHTAGLIHLIDAIQDAAVADGIASELTVFGELS